MVSFLPRARFQTAAILWELTRYPKFGHNDQKPAANLTLVQYQANLERLATEARAAGATPVSLNRPPLSDDAC